MKNLIISIYFTMTILVVAVLFIYKNNTDDTIIDYIVTKVEYLNKIPKLNNKIIHLEERVKLLEDRESKFKELESRLDILTNKGE